MTADSTQRGPSERPSRAEIRSLGPNPALPSGDRSVEPGLQPHRARARDGAEFSWPNRGARATPLAMQRVFSVVNISTRGVFEIMPATILVIDHDIARQRVLDYSLRQEGYAVTAVPNGKEGQKAWRSLRPALAILDADLPREDVVKLLAKLREVKTARHIPIVMISPDGDAARRLLALRAGADEVVARGTHPAELLARVRNLLVRYAPETFATERPRRRGSILAFVGARGGAGTTTVAANTAIVLHRKFGRRVALIDGNLQFGDHRIFFDLPRDTVSVLDLVGSPTLEEEVLTAALVRHPSGLDLLLGPPTPTTAELVTTDDLPRILGAMRPYYDYLVVDMDRRLDEYNLRLLDVADSLFVVLTPDLPSLKNTRLVLETAPSVGFPENRIQLVLNRATAGAGDDLHRGTSALDKPVGHHILSDERTSGTAISAGSPVVLAKPDSPLGKASFTFASEVDALAPNRSRAALVPVEP